MVSKIPFERVLEFWLSERVQGHNLVPLAVASESKYYWCCMPTSSVRTRWKRVIQREQMQGLVQSIETCARNRYYTTLAEEFEHEEMEEEKRRRKLKIAEFKEYEQYEQYEQSEQHEQDEQMTREERKRMRETKRIEEMEEKNQKRNKKQEKEEKEEKEEKKEKKEKDSVNKYLIEIPVLMTSKEATVKHPKWIMLHSLGYTMEMAGYALAINHNSLQAAEEWLLKQTFQENQQLQGKK